MIWHHYGWKTSYSISLWGHVYRKRKTCNEIHTMFLETKLSQVIFCEILWECENSVTDIDAFSLTQSQKTISGRHLIALKNIFFSNKKKLVSGIFHFFVWFRVREMKCWKFFLTPSTTLHCQAKFNNFLFQILS